VSLKDSRARQYLVCFIKKSQGLSFSAVVCLIENGTRLWDKPAIFGE